MTTYSRKRIDSLTPQWWKDLPKEEKQESRALVNEEAKRMWENRPKEIGRGITIQAKESKRSVTKGCKYKVQGHFCTLVTTIHGSLWHQFVTFKNDHGWTVKMNLNGFEVLGREVPLVKYIKE